METTEDLELAARCARAFFTPREIALVLEVEVEHVDAAIETKSALGKVILKNWLLNILEVRESEIPMAKRGSTPAQARVAELIKRLQL